ncbi:molybdopterin-guanine dinucleotide biosynthesis protein MobB [Halalkalibacter wakoensis JCM 9140]|uniref:Molybdopterin-guanine dinucleotide biosynthesis protein MobB n=1 Tax=Halalkalibacter wakoensis JCM 9140 TaxID=1236970 RepID=W4Q161_9BACI|nr:molybdopterin-guanine dinucleotide biosynthesis protein MobB [Halalkalibacter wakoensis JCM 9140]
MGQHRRILQVVGYQNSGKTTLMETLISRCSELGMKVATVKHHGHATPQTNEATGKDSVRHQQAGADMTAVEGGGSLQIHVKQPSWSLDDILKLYENFSPDVILVEGFKKAPYPKVVLLRGEEDVSLIETATNIECVITWGNVQSMQAQRHSFPIFSINSPSTYTDYILQKLSDEK